MTESVEAHGSTAARNSEANHNSDVSLESSDDGFYVEHVENAIHLFVDYHKIQQWKLFGQAWDDSA